MQPASPKLSLDLPSFCNAGIKIVVVEFFTVISYLNTENQKQRLFPFHFKWQLLRIVVLFEVCFS